MINMEHAWRFLAFWATKVLLSGVVILWAFTEDSRTGFISTSMLDTLTPVPVTNHCFCLLNYIQALMKKKKKKSMFLLHCRLLNLWGMSLVVHAFHGGFMHNCLMKGLEDMDCISRTRSVQKTTTKKQTHGFAFLAKFALKDYNKKHKTKLEYVMAVKHHTFECMGLSMDFREKYTTWDHMNFVARCSDSDGSHEDLFLFAELYLGDDNKPVLATLSPLNENFTLNESGCLYCPNTICHPHRDYLYCWKGSGGTPRNLWLLSGVA
ncbi:unnamed protein product [Cuscuta epithymum]|uniref:DUF3615 domain-containing protein n=1 Tax=Cuscuta epithymum TaxID=186058 RepID=A0AAV0EC91_9ASTE|nr:unnamed protein product [Cuscuta epithymum]